MAEISSKPWETPCFSGGSRPSQSYRSPDLLWTSSVRADDQSGSCIIWQTAFPVSFPQEWLLHCSRSRPFLMRRKQTGGGSAEEPDTSLWFCVRCLLDFFRISWGREFQILVICCSFFRPVTLSSICPANKTETRDTQHFFITSISLHKWLPNHHRMFAKVLLHYF